MERLVGPHGKRAENDVASIDFKISWPWGLMTAVGENSTDARAEASALLT